MSAKRAKDPATPDESTRVFTEKETGWQHYTTAAGFLTRVRKVGPIILDPCDNQESHTDADNSFFGPDTGGLDGLAENWLAWVNRARRPGVIFVNPPYGDQLPIWMEKIAQASVALRAAPKWRGTIALIPSRTDTGWVHDRILGPNTKDDLPTADAWVFVRGRMQFGNPPPDPKKKKKRSGSTMANLVVYWGRYVDAFAEGMAGLGLLVR